MKLTTLITFLSISTFIFCQDLSEYDLKPYNDSLKFKIIDENEVLEKDESLQAVIIVFKHQYFDNVKLSISNNPQLREIKIFVGDQDLLNFLSFQKLPNLTHLFFKQFVHNSLEIPEFTTLKHLTIQSANLETLNMVNAKLDNLMLLEIETPKLKLWKADKYFPKLELIGLNAPNLDFFPIENMPKIFQFSYHCSFKYLPLNLCSYDDLNHISFNNFIDVKLEKCFRKKVKMAYYSNVTVYNKVDGQIITEVVSKDRK